MAQMHYFSAKCTDGQQLIFWLVKLTFKNMW